MKKIAAFLLLLCCSVFLYAEEKLPRVYLQSPLYEEGNSQLATISYTVFDTAGLILSMLGQYDLVRDRETVVEDIVSFSRKNGVDRFISGNCSIDDSGAYQITLSVYDSELEKTVASRQETADTALDVFDAVDRLVIPLLEELSGREIAFGTIALENRGAEGIYRFYLDGVEYPPEEDVLDRILFGKHTVRIEQDRMEGRYVVDHETVEVLEDGVTAFHFAIPGILGREERELSDKEEVIEKFWDRRMKEKRVDEAFGELLVMLDDVSYSSDMEARKQSILAKKNEWEAFKYERENSSPHENRDGRLILSLGLDFLGLGVYDPDSYKSYSSGDPVDFHVKGIFGLPKLGVQYFLTDHHALLARLAILGGDGKVTPETVANSEGESSIQGIVDGGVELTLGYEYYREKMFFGINAEARALDLFWETASDSGTLEPPSGQNAFGFSLEPKVGILLNQKGDFVYKLFLSIGAAIYSVEGEGAYIQPLDSIRVGFSAGYGAFRF